MAIVRLTEQVQRHLLGDSQFSSSQFGYHVTSYISEDCVASLKVMVGLQAALDILPNLVKERVIFVPFSLCVRLAPMLFIRDSRSLTL